MEFNEKLQELRKGRRLTQEELAEALFVSRTAVSKWESGRGYPNIDSLKAVAKFFSVTVDDLLSGDSVITIAELEQKQRVDHIQDLVFGLLDLALTMLIFLPFFAERADGVIREASLLTLGGSRAYLTVCYFAAVIAAACVGVLTLALQNIRIGFWEKSKRIISLTVSAAAVLLFTLTLHPYAASFAFVLLAVKALTLIKGR